MTKRNIPSTTRPLVSLAASAVVLALAGCVSGAGSSGSANNSSVPPINETDRVLWLTLNQSAESDVADASPHAQTITELANTASAAGIAGNGRSFRNDPDDLNNSFINIADADSLDLTTALSMAAWVKPTLDTQTSFIVAKNQGWNINMAYALAVHNGALEVLLADNAYPTKYVLPVDQWTHVAATWDGATLRVFANGIQIYRKNNVVDAILPNELPLMVGARNRQSAVPETQSFTGTIDEVSVYRVALLPGQVCLEAGRVWESGTCSGGAFGGATPVAESATFNTNADDVLTALLTATDTDSDELIYSLGDVGTKGIVTITNPTTGAFSFKPYPLAEGADEFTFYATDGVNRSEVATITVNITRTLVDTDGDGMFDHIERAYGLDPNDAADALTDLDGDGVNNRDEVNNGTDPTISNADDASRVAAFGFNEGTGLLTFDHSTAGNNGTLNRPDWVMAPKGIALEFHGTDAVTVNDSFSLDVTTGLTISAWINPEVADQQSYVLAKNYGWSEQMSYGLAYREGKLRAVLNSEYFTTTATIPSETWSHVAVTWDGTTVKFYINGTLVETAAYPGTLSPTLTPNDERLVIGGRNRLGTSTGELFTGFIDQVQVWNAAKTDADVCSIFGGTLDGANCVN